jgi:hypothetical protein
MAERLIVLVSERPRSREAKQALALRSKGWGTIILYLHKPNYELSKYFDEAIQYQDPIQALMLAKDFSPVAYHVHSLMSADATALAFMKYKPGKIVYDLNDSVDAMHTEAYINSNPEFQERRSRELHYLQNADGLCCRDLQVQHTCHKHNIKRDKDLLYFPEYCMEREVKKQSITGQNKDDIHLAVSGNFGVEKMGEEDGYLRILELLIKQEVHTHFYPHWFNYNISSVLYDNKYSDYITLARQSPFVHMHHSVPMDNVVNELQRYDCGIHTPHHWVFPRDTGIYNVNGLAVCGSSRVYDFLDAGIPGIMIKNSYTQKLLTRYKVGINGTLNFFVNARRMLKGFLGSGVYLRVRKAQAAYSIYRHADRLIRFYQKVGGCPDQRFYSFCKQRIKEKH